MSNQVCVISIYVPNINEAVDFYTNTLGFELNKQYGTKTVSLVHGELPIVLEENENATYHKDSTTTGVALSLKTEDIYATVRFLKEKEVNFIVDEPTNCPPGKYISIKDPFSFSLKIHKSYYESNLTVGLFKSEKPKRVLSFLRRVPTN